MSCTIGTRDEEMLAQRLANELQVVRLEIREGRFQRSMAIIAAFSAIVSGYEAYAQHLRGAFAKWLMWTPVALTVPTVLAAIAALFSERAARRVLLPVSLVSLADGVIGFVYHVRGIERMPGGFRLGQYNVVMGPPIFAPLLLCTVGVLGMLAGLLRREKLYPSGGSVASSPEAPGDCPPDGMIVEFASDVAHGSFQQSMAVASALFALLSGGEAYFEHLRGSFNRRVMWAPVWVTAPAAAAGFGAVISGRVAHWMLPLSSIAAFMVGFAGFLLHLQGIRRMPGGFGNIQFNATLGPPLFAPLLFSAVGLLGFIAALLRRRGGKRC